MNIIIKFIALQLLLLSQVATAENLGLGQEVYTRYLKYKFQPKHREVFKSLGHRERFLKQNVQMLRSRVTPMLERIKREAQRHLKSGLPLLEYNPALKFETLNPKTVNTLKLLKFPSNIRWKSRSDYSKGDEFIELSFSKAPSQEQLISIMTSLEQLFALNLKPKPLDKKTLQKRKLMSDAEKEMLEPIREKQYVLYKYHQYYGLYYKFQALVHGEYFADLKNHLNTEFADLQQNFKFKFLRDSQVNMAINAKILVDLQEQIEESDFKDLGVPFSMPIAKLPKSYLRIQKDTEASEIQFLFARKENSDSIVPALKSVINQI